VLRAQGLFLKEDQVYSFCTPLFLGGQIGAENIEASEQADPDTQGLQVLSQHEVQGELGRRANRLPGVRGLPSHVTNYEGTRHTRRVLAQR